MNHVKGAAILHWLVPPGFQDLLRRMRLAWQGMSAPKKTLLKNQDLKDRHLDKDRCFVIATGPSIKEQDLSLLQGEFCITLSNFFVHKDFGLIKPRYHCVPRLYFPPLTEEDALRWFTDMDAKLGESMLLLDVAQQPFVDRHRLFQGRDVRYLAFGRTWDRVVESGIDPTKPLPAIQSSPVMGLQVALFMGFKNIYLLGCDHDWILNVGTTRHFYDEKLHAGMNRPGFSEWTGMEDTARSYGVLWGHYRGALRFAESKGVRLFNATAGGLMNVFPRVRFESLFQRTPLDGTLK